MIFLWFFQDFLWFLGGFVETRWLGWQFLNGLETTLAGWVSDFVSVCLETRWLGQELWFLLYFPEAYCIRQRALENERASETLSQSVEQLCTHAHVFAANIFNFISTRTEISLSAFLCLYLPLFFLLSPFPSPSSSPILFLSIFILESNTLVAYWGLSHPPLPSLPPPSVSPSPPTLLAIPLFVPSCGGAIETILHTYKDAFLHEA